LNDLLAHAWGYVRKTLGPKKRISIIVTQSTCVRCGGTRFEVVPAEPKNTCVKLRFIQCVNCGGVAGVLDYHPLAFLFEKLAKALGVKLPK
jgi:hypothetical protein